MPFSRPFGVALEKYNNTATVAPTANQQSGGNPSTCHQQTPILMQNFSIYGMKQLKWLSRGGTYSQRHDTISLARLSSLGPYSIIH